VIEHANASMPFDAVSIEGEIHFLDTMAFGAVAEARLGAGGAAAEQDAVARPWSCCPSYQRASSGLAGSAVMFSVEQW
jgi:hypothetical protein